MSKVNLDIKKKVNSPADNGSAGQLLRTNGDGSTSWINIPNDEQVKDSVNEYLRDNFSNPSSPPLDRTLSSPDAAAAADAVGAFKSVMGDYVMDYTEAIEIDPHQLWNKDVVNAEPYLTENKIGINTSTRIAYNYNKGRIYAIEVNGELGDLFTFNLLNSKTFADFNITSAELYASNIIPVDGSTLLQRGVTGWEYYRATISLTQPSKYLIIALQCSTSDIDENKADCDAFMSNVVVRKGAYDTTYYDYIERTVITPDYHVVKSDFGRGNAGRMLIIGGNGKVTTGTIVDPQVSDGVGYHPLQSVRVGEDLISNVTDINLGEGWSGDLTNGLVHERGEESSVVLSIPLTANTQYLMTFNASSHYEESLFVAFGNDDDIDVYTSESFKAVGFISDGENKIKIRAVSGLGVTITNVALYELQPNGTEMILDAKNVNHGSTQSNISGFWNVAIGDETTQTNNVSGTRNIAIGLSSQYRLQQGNRNIAIGTFSMPFVKEGERNVAIGADALYSGEHRLSDNRAYDNVAIGKAAMHDGSLIQRNVAIGSRAMKDSDAQATDNTVVGFQAGNYAHNYNTIVGKRAGYYTKGDHNTALGWEAGGDLYVSGTRNVSIGSLAGFDKTGASAASPKLMNNTITVGYGVKAEASNEARFGNTDQKVFLAGKEIVFNEGGFVTWGDNDASGEIAEALAGWLEEHPEAVTTVEDGSITKQKLHATVNRDIQDIKDDLEETQNALGLIGSLTDYGTTHPLVINDVTGTYVDLEFSTATSFLEAGKNLYPNSIDSFTRTKTVMLPMTYPAGTYVFSSYVTSTDTDKTFCWVGFSNGTNYVTPYTQGKMYRDQRTECVMTPSGAFDRIVLFASDDFGHSAGDDAVFSNTQLDWGSEPSNYIPYNGLVRSVTDRIVLAHDYTILISNDGSDIHASSRNGSREPIIPQLESELSALTPYASQSDVGKFLKLKSASEGKATSYEYGTVAALDDNAGTGDVDRTWSANKLSKIKSDVTNVKQELGLEGQPVNYGTRHPLKIEDSPGVVVDLEFTTAQSYLISNRNLTDAGTKTFTRTKVCQLPMELPAGTYTFSAGIQSNDTDSTKCQVNFQKDGVSVGYKNINRGERIFDVITATGPFTNIVISASDTYGHAAGDTATFTDMQLEWGDLVTDYIQYDGHIREVANINSITLEYPQTYIFTNDKSEVHGSSIAGDVHHYVADLQTTIEKMQSLKGKKIIAFGDSIWGNDRTYGVADYLAEYSGATIYNCAIGGTRVTGDRNQYEGPAYAPFDGVNLIRSLLDQDWTDQDANVDNVISYVKTDTLPLLKTIDLSEMDIIVLAYGHNDFTAPRTIAQVQAAYDEVVSMILDEYPSKRIVIVAPPWRMFNSTDGDTYENSQGVTLRQMSDGIIAGAKAKHITCINMLDELPWRNETKQYYLDNDSVHPNVEGNKVYARVMCEKLRSMTSWSAVSTEDAIADGTISESKLDSELRDKLGEIEYKAPAIIGSVTGYRHENVEAFTMNGNQFAFGHARYADKKNLIIAEDKTFTASNVEVTISGGIAVLNGTNSGGADDRYFAQHEVDMPAGNYTFAIEPYAGSTTLSGTKNMHLDLWYDGNTSSTRDQRVTLSINDTAQSNTFTIPSHVYKLRAWFGIRSSSTYTDYRLFFSLFPSNVTIVDTGETIEPLGTLYVTPENAMPVVDTMMHTSTIRTVVDTKTYIDNHTQDVNFVCFRPEDYGAKGDGVANDSAALQACIDAAQAYSNETGVCIRGYGTYKLNTGIVFNCRELDVYINKIIYTGPDAAVQLSASFSRFEFQSIRAHSGGNNAVCIRCYQSLDSGYTTTFHSNVVTCSFMRSSGNCVEFAEASGLTQHTMMYNDFYCQYQRSDNANIFAVLNRLANEINCYGKYVCAQNGYLLYYDKVHGAGGTIRMFYYCLETDLKNGTNGEGRFYYCRFRELEDLQSTSDRTIGRIYKWDNIFPQGEIVNPTGGIDLTAVDVSNNCSWEDCLGRVKDYFEENPNANSYEAFSRFIPISIEPYAKFDVANRVANARLTSNDFMTTIPAGTMYAYYDNIAFKPHDSIYKLVDDDMTIQLTSSNGWTYLTPTTFDINTTSATITLDASYCCIAINEFDVIQHEGKTAIVVDKLGNTIFNGTNRGPGRFHFKCDFVPYGHNEIYVTLDNSTVKYLNDSLLPSIYSGYNEQWSVTSYLEDGSVSYARLDTSLKGKMDDIDEVTCISHNKYNILSPEWLPAGTVKTVEITRSNDVFTFNGTASGSDSATGSDLKLIPGAKYTVKIYTASNKNINASIRYRYNNAETVLSSFGSQLNTPVTVTIPSAYDRIYLKLGVVNSTVYSGDQYRISLALGESNPKYEKYAEGLSAYDGYARNEIETLHTNLDYMRTYVTPEMFGAVGNETIDDTTAIENCFAYAVSNRINVRGKGVYRISHGISVTADRLNIDLYQLSSWTTFDGYLLTINGSRNNISFDTLQSTHSKGLLLTNSANKESRNNTINIGYLLADGDGLTIEGAAANYISYNTFNINRIKSYSGNCIVNGDHSTENRFYNTQLEAENGWGVYGTGSGKYYSLCMEETLLNGIYCKHMDGGEFHGCRHSELTTKLMNRLDGTRPNTTGGTLIKIVGGTGSVRYESNQQVAYMSVDVSEAWDISDTRFDEDLEQVYNPILHRVQSYRGCTQILAPIVHYTYSGAYGGLTIADGMIVLGNKKVCRPFYENKYTVVDADFDMRDSLTPQSGKPYPTKFVIGVASCVIHLPSSYCCAGFNRIIVDQSDATKLCTIYDDYSNTAIFDGSTLGAGVYELIAEYDVDTIDPIYSQHLQRNIPQYTGNNGVWEITKIS